MAISFVGSNSSWGTGVSSLSVNFTAKAGDFVVLYAGVATDTAQYILSVSNAGWTKQAELYADSATEPDFNLAVFTKVMGATPDSSVTFSASGGSISDEEFALVQVFRGVDLTTPLDVTPTTSTRTSSANPDPAAITPVTPGAWIVVGGGAGSVTDAPQPFTNPGGLSSGTGHFISRAEGSSTAAGIIGMGFKSDWTSGSYDPLAFTGGSASSAEVAVAVTLALRPAPDTTAPTITSASSVTNTENTTLSHNLTANETVTWAIRTTAENASSTDAAKFELSGSTLSWLSNGTKNFEAPDDSNGDNVYVVVVRATDAAGNFTDQTISVTVVNEKIIFVGSTRGDAANGGNVALALNSLVNESGATVAAAAGDHVVVMYAIGSAVDRAMSVSEAGWTNHTELYSNGTTYDTNLAVFSRRMPATPDTAVTCVGSAHVDESTSGIAMCFRNVDPTTPLDVAIQTAIGTGTIQPNPPAITPATAGSWIVVCGAGNGTQTGATLYTNPGDLSTSTNQFRAAGAGDVNTILTGMGLKTNWSTGAFDPLTFTGGTPAAADQSWAAATLALRLNQEDPAPTITSSATHTTPENQVYSATATANETVTWSVSGADAAIVSLNNTTGAWSIPAQDYETKPTVSFNLIATDSANNVTTQAVTVTITDIDEIAPTITSSATHTTPENQVYSATATANETVTWSKSGTDAAIVTLDAATGAWSIPAQDYEVKTSVSFNLIATDAAGNATTQPVTVTITNVDDTPPTITSASTFSVVENTPLSHTLTSNEGVTWSVSGTDAALVTIDTATGTWSVAPQDYEARTSISFTLEATDVTGNVATQPITLNITDVADSDVTAPTITSTATHSTPENQVYSATATANETVTWSVTGTDAALVTINASTGTWSVAAQDYETRTSLSFNIVATDTAGNVATQPVTLTITDVVDTDVVAPTITSTATHTVPENQPYSATATANETVTWSKSGPDATIVTLNTTTGDWSIPDQDYETKTSVLFTLTATDTSGNTSSQNVTVNITDVVDETPPVITSTASHSTPENQIYSATATANETVTWSKAGPDAALVTLNNTTGAWSVPAQDYETRQSVAFDLIATDAAGLSSSQRVVLEITDIVSEGTGDTTPPSLTSPTGSSSTTSSANVGATTNEADGTMYAVVTTSATQPTAAQIEAGQNHLGNATFAASQLISSTGAKSLSITGLAASTTYYGHIMHKDAAGNRSTPVSTASFATKAADTTPPTLSSPSAKAGGTDTTLSVAVTTDEGGGTLHVVASLSATKPSPAQVKAGQDHTGATVPRNNFAVGSAGGTITGSISSLTAGTTYYVHFCHEDAAANLSAVVTSGAATTTGGTGTTDTTPPKLTLPTGTSTGSTTGTGGATTDEPNGVMYVVATTAASTPSATQIEAGLNASGTATPNANSSVTATGAKSIAISGLSSSTTYYAHIVHKDVAGNYSNVVSSASFTTSASDTVAPKLTLPTGTSSGSTTGTGGATTDEANGVMYVVATTSATPPSAAQIESGLNSSGTATPNANINITSTGAKSLSISGLSASTTYYAHVIHKDNAGNRSNIVSSAAFTTSADTTSDTTAPSLTTPTGTQTSATTGTGGATTNEANGTIFVVATTSTTKPTPAQVENGLDHLGFRRPAGNIAVTSTGAKSVPIGGLTAATTYYAHTMHKDAAGNRSTVATSASFATPAAGSETTVPSLTSPTGSSPARQKATVSVSTNEGNGTLYCFLTTIAPTLSDGSANPSAPSANTIRNFGQRQVVTSTGTKTFTAGGLDPPSTYYAYFVQVDGAGNVSARVNSSSFVINNDALPAGSYLVEHTIINHPYSNTFFTSSDPNKYSSISAPTQRTHNLGSNDGSVNCYIFVPTYSDSSGGFEIIVNSAYGEASATSYATTVAQAMGRLPRPFRDEINWIGLLWTTTGLANAEDLGHYVRYSKDKLDERINSGHLEELFFHESMHVSMQRKSEDGMGYNYLGSWHAGNPVNGWKAAVEADNNKWISGRASDNHGEDMAETGHFAWVLKYRPDRIPAADRDWMRANIPNRLKYMDEIVFPTSGV